MSYFSGPSTRQMRLTVFLIGAALFGFGIFVGTLGTTVTGFHASEVGCGSPFSPYSTSQFHPDLAQACSSANIPGRALAIACLAIGGASLIRLLYMLIGSKGLSTH